MKNYIVSARKYRPSTFRSVVGQQALTHTLKTAIDSGRLAHAYLFCGPRGVGKTSCARIFAKTINCLSPTPEGEACNQCESCVALNEQRSYNIVELDAASNNSVDDIRALTEQVRIPPQIGKYRVFIIDEVHMLSTQAFNAFLKTLEEPPAHAIFILATTEKHKVIPTILSRCQIYDFSRITVQDIVEQLQYIASQEGITAEATALNVIAQKADGAMRDALSIFDQVAASSQGNITYQSTIDNLNVLDHDYYFKLVDAFMAVDVPQALLIYKDVRDKGFDSLFFINGLAEHIRNLMVAATPATKCLLETTEEVANQFVVQGTKLSPQFFYRALDLCNKCDLDFRTATNKQLLVELTLIKLCQLFDNATPLPAGGDGGTDTLRKIEPVKRQGSVAQAQPTPTPEAPRVAPAAPATTTTTAPVTPTPTPVATPVAPVSRASSATMTAEAGVKRVMPRILINARGAKGGDAASAAKNTTQRRTNAYTDEALYAAWHKFIELHPREQIIINTMRCSLPRKISENVYEIEVENQVQVESFNAHKMNIMTFLRDSIENDMLAIEVKINPYIERPKFWTPQEIVASIKEYNPYLEKFIDDFDLALG